MKASPTAPPAATSTAATPRPTWKACTEAASAPDRNASAVACGSAEVWGSPSGSRLASASTARPCGAEADPAQVRLQRRAEDRGHHRSDGGGPEQAGDAGHGVVDRRGDPGLPLRAGEHRRRQRRHGQRQAEREHELGREHVGDVVEVVPDALEQEQAGGGHERPEAHEQARPVAVGEHAEATREQEHHERHRQRREADSAAACSPRSAAGTGPGTGTGSPAPRRGRTSPRCRRRSSGA